MARQGRHAQDQPEAPDAGQRHCARAEWCDERVITHEDGTVTVTGALTSRAFCDCCERRIAACLDELPDAYRRLSAEIGEAPRNGHAIRVPFGPRLPLRADIDALMRLTAEILSSWEERTRAIARLSPLDTELSRRRGGLKVVEAAAQLLGAHLSALLALSPEPMARPDGGTMTLPELGGADAGLEILRLHYRARAVLGEIRAAREPFDGVPCRECGDFALERAEPPSDPKTEAMHSRCDSCSHQMNARTYAAWAAWYARWAATTGPRPCRRCQQQRCAECEWPACACASAGHEAALAGVA